MSPSAKPKNAKAWFSRIVTYRPWSGDSQDSNHELDRILKVHKLLILQSRRSRQKHQNQVFGTKSVQIFCREFGSRLLPLDSSVNLQGGQDQTQSSPFAANLLIRPPLGRFDPLARS